LLSPEYPAGPRDQRAIENRADVLCFTSLPLDRDLEATGRVTVTLHARSSVSSTDWVARLCDVHPDGRSFNICDGVRRVTERADEWSEHTIDLWSTSNVFRRGHRLRVHITSSSFPRWDRHFDGADQSAVATHQVATNARRASHIELPIIPT
jgi:putative CocE/NonD family hydrolase